MYTENRKKLQTLEPIPNRIHRLMENCDMLAIFQAFERSSTTFQTHQRHAIRLCPF